MTDTPQPPVHLLVRAKGELARIGCGTNVASPHQYTDDYRRCSCKRCARYAPGLSDEQRSEVWDAANDRLGLNPLPLSPWVRARLRAEKKQRAAEKKAAAAARRAEKKARAA